MGVWSSPSVPVLTGHIVMGWTNCSSMYSWQLSCQGLGARLSGHPSSDTQLCASVLSSMKWESLYHPSLRVLLRVKRRLPWGLSGQEPTCQCRRLGFNHWVDKIPCRRKWQPTPGFLPGKSHGQRSLEGYSLQGGKESDMSKATQHACRQFIISRLIFNFPFKHS